VYFQAAGVCNLEPVAYEFFTQAFVIYEEEIAVSGALFLCIMHNLICTGYMCSGFMNAE
jgi:hypothetical protein